MYSNLANATALNALTESDASWITCIAVIPFNDGKVEWSVYIDGEDDSELAAGILERAVEVLRDK